MCNGLHIFMRYFRPSNMRNKLYIHIISSPISTISEMNMVLSSSKRAVFNVILHFSCRSVEDILFYLQTTAVTTAKAQHCFFSKIKMTLTFYVLNKMIYSGVESTCLH